MSDDAQIAFHDKAERDTLSADELRAEVERIARRAARDELRKMIETERRAALLRAHDLKRQLEADN